MKHHVRIPGCGSGLDSDLGPVRINKHTHACHSSMAKRQHACDLSHERTCNSRYEHGSDSGMSYQVDLGLALVTWAYAATPCAMPAKVVNLGQACRPLTLRS